MLLMTVLIVMIISAALMLALFSGFLPFVRNYGNVMQYTTAYYGALSAVERGVLATRYAGPGFDGESGWKKGVNGAKCHPSDTRLDHFYTYGDGQDSLFWSVKSSTERIPAQWKGNVDPNLIDSYSSDSRNYNVLNYGVTEVIPLGTVADIQPTNYYSSLNNDFQYWWNNIKVEFRFNPYLASRFSQFKNWSAFPLNKKESSLENLDLPFVNWIVKGESDGEAFSLLPKNSQNVTTKTVFANDTLIRWSQLNGDVAYDKKSSLAFSHTRDVFGRNFTTQNIVSSTLNSNIKSYKDILNTSNNVSLSLSLLNLLQTKGNAIYPFLEYKVTSDGKISDRFYTIEWEGKVNDYNIKMQVQKPTLPQPALGSFTILF